MRAFLLLATSAFVTATVNAASPATSAYTCTSVRYGGAGSQVTGINNKGDAVGWAYINNAQRAFLRKAGGTFIALKSPTGSDEFIPVGINNLGQILGQIAGPLFILNPDGTYIDIPPAVAPPGHTYSKQSITGINDKGELTGTILEDRDEECGTELVFIRSAGGQYKIIDQAFTCNPPDTITGPINNSEVVVEHKRYRDGFLLKPDGSRIPLIYPGYPFYSNSSSNGNTFTLGLNNENVTAATIFGDNDPIFGFIRTSDGQYPVVTCPGVPGQMGPYGASGAINDRNVIAGGGVIATPTGILPHLQISNPDWHFASHPIGQTSGIGRIFLSNTGPADLNIPGVYIAGTGKLTDEVSSFQITNTRTACGSFSEGAVLTPGSSCFVEFKFTPHVNGWQTAGIFVPNDSPTSPAVIQIGGTGIGNGTLHVSNTSWHFAPHPVGTVSSGPGVIYAYNAGQSTIKLNVRIDQDEAFGGFSFYDNTCGDSLAPFKTCAITFYHYSSFPGLDTATLNLEDTSANGPFRIRLYAPVTK